MTSPTGASFLDFFVLEAGEYVEQIDGLLLRAADAGPDPEALQKVSRALRGSATMAKLPSFAELASTVEAVGRALRLGTLGWDQSLKGALTAAVDDLKLLVRAARSWSPTEDQWAAKRIAELSRYAQPAGPAMGSTAGASGGFFAAEAGAIAAGLDAVVAHPDNVAGAADVLRRIRALRGVAGVREVSGLSEAAEASETAIHPIELGRPLAAEHVTMLRAAAELLRAIAAGVRSGEPVTTSTPAYRAYLSALDAIEARERGTERVIPIAELFHEDAGPHIVEKAPNPPTTPGQRFRMEVVSLGEHLHRVIDEARRATDDIQREHARGELGRALRTIRATAASFSQMAVAQTVEGHLERTGDLTAGALDAISQFAASISPTPQLPPAVEQHSVPFRMTHAREAVASLGTDVAAPPAPVPPPAPGVAPARASGSHARVFAAVTPPTSVPAAPAAPAPTAATAPTRPAASPAASPATSPVTSPAAAPLQAAPDAAAGASAMDDAIAAFDSLSSERFAEPVALGDDLVPVDALLYRGQAALERAIELRDALRRAGGAAAPEVLEEIYDLLDLARVPEPAF